MRVPRPLLSTGSWLGTIIAASLQVQDASTMEATSEDGAIDQAKLRIQQQDGAPRRFLALVKALAEVRRLAKGQFIELAPHGGRPGNATGCSARRAAAERSARPDVYTHRRAGGSGSARLTVAQRSRDTSEESATRQSRSRRRAGDASPESRAKLPAASGVCARRPAARESGTHEREGVLPRCAQSVAHARVRAARARGNPFHASFRAACASEKSSRDGKWSVAVPEATGGRFVQIDHYREDASSGPAVRSGRIDTESRRWPV